MIRRFLFFQFVVVLGFSAKHYYYQNSINLKKLVLSSNSQNIELETDSENSEDSNSSQNLKRERKIAVCISGQLRAFTFGSETFIEHLARPWLEEGLFSHLPRVQKSIFFSNFRSYSSSTCLY